MIPTLRILCHMGGLQRLLPFWILAMLLLGAFFSGGLLLALVYGAVLQFIVEYVMHRFLYHRDPPLSQGAFNTLYRSHIGHHEFPNDPEFFTGDDHWYAVRFGLVSFGLHTVVLLPFVGVQAAGLWSAVALFGGSVSAFAFYEYCHTIAHLNVPKGPVGRRITQSHLRHHFNDHNSVFHVSFGMGWIDRLFGTPYVKSAARDRIARDRILSLGMDPDDLRLVTARKAYGLPARPSAR